MNRTPNYRVWHNIEKRFVDFRSISFENEEIVYDTQGEGNYYDTSPFRDVVFQQYTGLKDSKGVDIYEGDLVNFSEEDKPFEVRYCVDSEGAYYGLIDPKDDTWGYKLSTDNEYEVVGNIFELPCKPDHNGECMVCDCWLSDCPLRK